MKHLALVLAALACTSCIRPAADAPLTLLAPIGPDQAVLKSQIAEFQNAFPAIPLDVQWIPAGTYQAKLRTLISANRGPDVFVTIDAYASFLVPFMHPLDDDADADSADFFPAVLEACRWNDRTYLRPKSFTIGVMLYNRDHFAEAGLAPPAADWNRDDFLSTAKVLADPPHRWAIQPADGWWAEWLPALRQAGVDLIHPDQPVSMINSPEALDALTFLYDRIHTHRIAPAPGRGPQSGFLNGSIAMQANAHTGLWPLLNSREDLDWDIAPLPRGPAARSTEITIEGFAINSASQRKADAWQLIQFLTRPEAIHDFVEKSGHLSVRQSIAARTHLAPGRTTRPLSIHVAYDSLAFAAPTPRDPHFIELALQIIQPEIDLLMENKKSPRQATDDAARAANAFLQTISPAIKPPH